MINDLFLEVTGACNLRCCHCYRKNKDKKHVGFDELKKRILSNKSRNVVVTGGEALLYPKLKELLKLIKDQGRTCILITNGAELLKYKDLILQYVDVLNVSLDWPDERHDDNRGLKGLAGKVINSLKELKKEEKRPKINILTTVFKENNDEIINLIKLSESIADNIVLDRYVPIHEYPTALTKEEVAKLFNKVHELKEKVKTSISVYDPIYYTLYPDEGVARKRCKARLFITTKGSFTICPFYFKKFLTKDEALDERANEPLPKECVGCKYETTCHGGCPATRLITNGLKSRDPYCSIKY